MTEQQIKPPITYFGGKTRIADRIVALFPRHGHYVEPFGGSLAVLLAKRPSDMETGEQRARLEIVWSNRPFPHEQDSLFID